LIVIFFDRAQAAQVYLPKIRQPADFGGQENKNRQKHTPASFLGIS
jgi:hypothetical protein